MVLKNAYLEALMICAMLLHVCSASAWEHSSGDNYKPGTFEKEGFIHCCLERQLDGVLTRYFKGANDLVLLSIDENKSVSEVKYEAGPDHDLFPHIYGPINRTAITSVNLLT
jgi:uncharacterized protein (DUF952 family)